MGIKVARASGYSLVAATMQRARIRGELDDRQAVVEYLLAGQRGLSKAGPPLWPDDHYSIDPAKAAFFASGAFAQLHDPNATIEHAAEVVRASSHADTRNFWPMRVANARVEWAMALVDLKDEDAAVAMATLALDPEWLRPDTERRTQILLRKMQNIRLRSQLAEQLHESRHIADHDRAHINSSAMDALEL